MPDLPSWGSLMLIAIAPNRSCRVRARPGTNRVRTRRLGLSYADGLIGAYVAWIGEPCASWLARPLP